LLGPTIAIHAPSIPSLSETSFMIRRLAVIAAALGLSLVGSESVQAQQKPPAIPGTPVKVDGKVEAVSPQGILMAG